MIVKNEVWDVVPRPNGKSVVTSKWLFKIKLEESFWGFGENLV